MKPGYNYKGTKRSMAYNILNNGMKIDEAVRITGAKPETVKRWLSKYGRDYLVTPATDQ